MNNIIKIRFATIEDAELLTEIAWKSFYDTFAHDPHNKPEDTKLYMEEAFSLKTITNDLTDTTVVYLIAEIEGAGVGYAKLKTDSTESCVIGEKPIELCRLYALKEWIGHRVGATLMNACFEYAERQEHDTMWLGVWEFNDRAQNFYSKFGFERVGEHIFLHGTDPQTDWVLQRAIVPSTNRL